MRLTIRGLPQLLHPAALHSAWVRSIFVEILGSHSDEHEEECLLRDVGRCSLADTGRGYRGA
jgi:hypothetical protein